jgi:hypothetical protein
MRLRVIVFGAVGAIEIALVRQVKAALERLAVEKTLAGFEQIIAGKFPADLIEQIHVIPGGEGLYGAAAPLSSNM